MEGGLNIPPEGLIGAIIGGLVLLGAPKLLDRIVAHREKRDDSLLQMLGKNLDAMMTLSTGLVESLATITPALEALSAKVEAQRTVIQALDRPPPVTFDMPTESIGE